MPDAPEPADPSGPDASDPGDVAFLATHGKPGPAPPAGGLEADGDTADADAEGADPDEAEMPPKIDATDEAETSERADASDRTEVSEELVPVDVSVLEAGIEDLRTAGATTAREETVTTGLAGLQKGIDELVRLTRRADEHVAELHAENQRLRAGEIEGATRPLLRDLVRLHDEVLALTEAAAEEARDDLALVRSRLLDALARWGLTADDPPTGSAMDPTRHHGVGTVTSSDAEPGTIASVRRIGFVHDDGRVLRAAEVEVFRAPPPPPGPTDGTPDPDDQES